jgi:hypothetical protein
MGWGFLEDVGNAVSSGLSTVGNAIEDGADAVLDTAEDLIDSGADAIEDGIDSLTESACENGPDNWLGDAVCAASNFVGGAISGAVEGIRDILDSAIDVVRDAVGIVGSLLRLDFAGVLNQLGNLFLDAFDLCLNVLRFVTLGTVVGGIVRQFQRDALRTFVRKLLQDTFGQDKARLARILKFVGLDGGGFGFPLSAVHKVFMLDSANTPLWDWHNRGVIDLYAMAGLLSFDSFQINRPRTLVRNVDASGNDNLYPVNRWIISHYIDSQGKNGRVRVYAMDRETIAHDLSVATDKISQLGTKLSWNDGERFSWFRTYTRHEIKTEQEYDFVMGTQGAYMLSAGLRAGKESEECTLLALGTFKGEDFGHTSGRIISEGSASQGCATTGRNDSCCSTLMRAPTPGDLIEGSGVTHRDVPYEYIFDYVFPHEIGHYLGLCHFGHDGIQNIMWRPGVGLEWYDWGLFTYYLESDPHFTLNDAKNSWRFLADQLTHCFPA